jgi:uncharacterized phiE125 gp8 family phage protein
VTCEWTLKTAAVFEPVSLDDAKDHLRVSSDDEDALIAAYLSAARQWVEAYTGRSLCTQTWQIALGGFTRDLWLPRAAPLQSITHVKYYDSDNVQQTWNSSNYFTPAFQEPTLLQPVDTATIPSVYCRPDAVQVEYITGYTSEACPEELKIAVLMLTAHFHENREAVIVGATGTSSAETHMAVTSLCSPYRVWWREPCL